jgi:hypothetical protein
MQGFLRKPEGNRSFGEHRCSLKDNIKVALQEMLWESADWFNLVQDREKWQPAMNLVMNLQVPHNLWNYISN